MSVGAGLALADGGEVVDGAGDAAGLAGGETGLGDGAGLGGGVRPAAG